MSALADDVVLDLGASRLVQLRWSQLDSSGWTRACLGRDFRGLDRALPQREGGSPGSGPASAVGLVSGPVLR